MLMVMLSATVILQGHGVRKCQQAVKWASFHASFGYGITVVRCSECECCTYMHTRDGESETSNALPLMQRTPVLASI